MSSPVLPLIYVAMIGVSAFNLFRGFHSNVIHFGMGVLGANADRRTDSGGFLIYATCNALMALMCACLLIYPRWNRENSSAARDVGLLACALRIGRKPRSLPRRYEFNLWLRQILLVCGGAGLS